MSSHRRAVAFPAGLSPSLATASGVIALTVVAVDQATKALVRWVLPLCSPAGCDGVHAGPLVFVNRINKRLPKIPKVNVIPRTKLITVQAVVLLAHIDQ